jgi:hypothetical protein
VNREPQSRTCVVVVCFSKKVIEEIKEKKRKHQRQEIDVKKKGNAWNKVIGRYPSTYRISSSEPMFMSSVTIPHFPPLAPPSNCVSPKNVRTFGCWQKIIIM